MLHKVITLANFKGGVGKSTSTAAIGACLAMKGYKVLLVDLDGQSNLTLYYVPNADIMEDSIFDTLVSGKAIPIINVKPNLDIVPSSLEMSSAEIAMTNTLAREQVLSRALSDVKVNYDFILIDCPPSLGIVTTNAFIAADEILVPMTPELLPLKGMKMLDSFVSSLKVVRPSVKLSGVFITRYNHRKLNKAVSEALKKRYADITLNTQTIQHFITMSKKNMDALLSNIMGEAIERPTEITVAETTQPDKAPLSSKEKKKDVPSRHFTFICSTELANKVQAIARKEGFTIRALMEYMMRQGVDSYESKHGKIKKIKAKGVSDVM